MRTRPIVCPGSDVDGAPLARSDAVDGYATQKPQHQQNDQYKAENTA